MPPGSGVGQVQRGIYNDREGLPLFYITIFLYVYRLCVCWAPNSPRPSGAAEPEAWRGGLLAKPATAQALLVGPRLPLSTVCGLCLPTLGVLFAAGVGSKKSWAWVSERDH